MYFSRRIIQLMSRQVGRRHASGYGEHGVHTTYNDLPSPSGSWQTNYDAQQRRYNAQLAVGVAVLAGTILFGKVTGMFEVYNDYPAKPAAIENYKD